ncbi:hypothetical protein JX265_008843 [Neoarthrinium moseri]|uniref:Uncharacterized protein n=1 Tax=Neoarthrinium moseri TaxID=1658444 RepID=A0A9P9WHM1_9PEZI|nr:uncharacterized protein JN550_009559 [Neoarthrinium moseri]KAI1863448.1 hypothetical protein JN550_009559 [Neoarthrinium moseri]KAI1863626.1 hypothetical protein JX265_008843 [Neoarthrinium moseri]
MSKLPLKVQVGIRDFWSKNEAPVQKALAALKETIGVETIIEPEWHLLLSELDGLYPDKSTFVPSIAGCVHSWCTALSTILDDSANEEWTDALLDHMKGRLRVFLEVYKGPQPALSWSGERTGFIISLPKEHVPSPWEMEPLFKSQSLACFDEKVAPATAMAHRSAPNDDWADVSLDAKTGKPELIDHSHNRTVSTVTADFERLPTCSILGRPDELLLKPPYHIAVYDRGTTLIEVHGSHSPSLQLLAEYLKKWCRVNHQDSRKPPGVEIKLHQSSFGLGLIYDRLTLSVENRYTTFTLSPMIVLSFIEGVLGYKSVIADGNSWKFRKDIEFRTSGY